MAYVMTDRYKEPAMPSSYYYNGILVGYRQNGLPVAALRRVWQQTAKATDGLTVYTNGLARTYAQGSKRRNSNER